MTTARWTLLTWTLALLLLTVPAAAADPADAVGRSKLLAQRLDTIRTKHQVPGLAAAMMRGDEFVASAAVGVRAEGHDAPLLLGDALHLGSETKAMTATLAAILIEQGKIAWDATIAETLPSIADKIRPEYGAVTLEQLLMHRSGLPDDAHMESGVWAAMWRIDGPMRERRLEAARITLAQKPLGAPGERWLYTNLGYTVAGAMLEAAADAPWEQLIGEQLFTPLHLTSAGFGPPGTPGAAEPDAAWGHGTNPDGTLLPRPPGPGADNPAVIGPAGTVHLSIEDFARFGRLHVAGARGAEGLLLPSRAIRRLHEPPAGGDYAKGWGITERPWGKGTVLTHAGSNTMWFAVAWLAPERDATFVAACNSAQQGGPAACDAAIATMVQEFLRD